MDEHDILVRFFITSGTTVDCIVAALLIEGFQVEYLLADRGYNTDAIILKAVKVHMIPVIPPKKNRKQLGDYDEYLNKLRHLVEGVFLLLKRWRGIATLYAKEELLRFTQKTHLHLLHCYTASSRQGIPQKTLLYKMKSTGFLSKPVDFRCNKRLKSIFTLGV